jgi:hypothetical protein
MLNAVTLNAVMLNVIMLSVVSLMNIVHTFFKSCKLKALKFLYHRGPAKEGRRVEDGVGGVLPRGCALPARSIFW